MQGIELRYVGQRCLILNLALDSLMSEGISFFLSFRSGMGFTSTFKLSTASYWSFRISIAFSRLSIDLSQNASVLVAPALRRCRAYKEMARLASVESGFSPTDVSSDPINSVILDDLVKSESPSFFKLRYS